MKPRPRIFTQSLAVLFGFVGLSAILTLAFFIYLEFGNSGWLREVAHQGLIYIFFPSELSLLRDPYWPTVIANIVLTAVIISFVTLLVNQSLRIRGSVPRSSIFSLLISAVSFMIAGAIYTGLLEGFSRLDFERAQLFNFLTLLGAGLLKSWLPALAAVVAYHAEGEKPAEPDEVRYPGKLKIKWREDVVARAEASTEAEAEVEISTAPTSILNSIVSSQFLQSALNAISVIVILVGVAYASNLIQADCSILTVSCVEQLIGSWIWPIFLLLASLAAAFGVHQVGRHHEIKGAIGLAFFISLVFIGILWAAGGTSLFVTTLSIHSWVGLILDFIITALACAFGAIIGYHIPQWGL